MNQANLRHVPSVEKLLQALGEAEGLPRALVAEVVKREVAAIRVALQATGDPEGFDEVVRRLRHSLRSLCRTRLQPVINGTGVILHTNLGRAPLSARTAEAMRSVAAGYSNVEIEIESGERGPRGALVERLLALLCEADAAAVVNNCAAALVLMLQYFVREEKREIIISRGELIEIGGGFRIPDILRTSGATLREVGTTNKTTVTDYERAITGKTALILKVHRSNFYVEGFTASAELGGLATLGRKHGIPVAQDLGSGAMADTDALNALDHEPTAAESLRTGIDLVCVSGDKLFGGPQAGILAGRAEVIREIKQQPFFRVLRCDKLILAAMQETALEYLEPAGAAGSPVPVLQMLALTEADLLPRAEKIAGALGGFVRIGRTTSRCGGGTMPRSALASVSLDLRPVDESVEVLSQRLRLGLPPVISHITEGVVKIDLRTVLPSQDGALIAALLAVRTGAKPAPES